MSNSYFSFKQFTVQQDACAMKVSTDACIQGAWTPLTENIKRVLDIGAGTGLLSLMIAQRAPDAYIDAIELNGSAARQAEENVAASPFAGRINVLNADATAWQSDEGYDLIICNPPFFRNSLTGPNAARNAARHTASLNLHSLIEVIARNLAIDGLSSIMWPADEQEAFAALAADSGLYMQRTLLVRDRAGTRITRIIGIYGRQNCAQPAVEELIIKSADGSYMPEFCRLLSPFYLRL
jgi:tRNA1Val (adenine37-N6)-methyltransferase